MLTRGSRSALSQRNTSPVRMHSAIRPDFISRRAPQSGAIVPVAAQHTSSGPFFKAIAEAEAPVMYCARSAVSCSIELSSDSGSEPAMENVASRPNSGPLNRVSCVSAFGGSESGKGSAIGQSDCLVPSLWRLEGDPRMEYWSMPALLYSEKPRFCRKIRLQKPDLLQYVEFHTIHLRCQGNLRHNRAYPEKSGGHYPDQQNRPVLICSPPKPAPALRRQAPCGQTEGPPALPRGRTTLRRPHNSA